MRQIAIDDPSFLKFETMVELKPDYVKLICTLSKASTKDPVKTQFVRSIQSIQSILNQGDC